MESSSVRPIDVWAPMAVGLNLSDRALAVTVMTSRCPTPIFTSTRAVSAS